MSSLLLLLCLPLNAAPVEPLPKTVQFNRDIRPILSENCFQCHGPDKNQRKADLRLDLEKGAFADLGGYRALEPGKPTKSALFQRITAKEAHEQMPPRKTGKKLTPRQLALVKRWIEQGAKWQKHWSLIPPTRPKMPRVEGARLANPIDAFIVRRLRRMNLQQSPRASARTLIRRLYFDLIGLPPSPEAVAQFKVEDFDRAVNRLLASPQFGERLGIYWLDVVRYADTNGIHGDNHRDIALYRDYVIDAFNENKRFDQFTLEQLAGDLLKDATDEQKIASGFNKLLMTTREGGAQAKEYLAKYASDRVRNTSTIFMGVTLGCAECHDHKFDPFTQKDFYSFAAFFADVRDVPVGKQPTVQIPTSEQRQQIQQIDEEIAKLQKDKKQAKRVAELRKQRAQILKQAPRTMISMRVNPRTMRILPRGNWLDDSGKVVQPATPPSLSSLAVKGRASRLDLANWLTKKENPLFARVFVNRLWKLFFGQGIVKTLDDFGSQGTWPTHPELLDWLAIEFRESGWDVKHMIRLMVSTETYKQSSRVTKELRERDPYNRLLARQSRFRLDAEMIRDNALSVSGLLSLRMGGRSVKPYQPSGYWVHLNFPKRTWKRDQGENLYRRGVYTYWCRTFLHPAMLAFDAPTREECTVERPRSNTPQQALVLLNDPTFVESARALATLAIRKEKETSQRLDFVFRRALQRSPRPLESRLLTALLKKHLDDYGKKPQEAAELIRVGDSPAPSEINAIELAAWTSVTRALMNLHETITRN